MMLAAGLSLSVLEIIVLLTGAIILGITIHFFISSRKSLKATSEEMERSSLARDEWKLRYFNDMEQRDKETSTLKNELQEASENSNIYSMEADEMRKQNRLLKIEVENARQNGEGNQAQASTIEELRRQNRSLREEIEGLKLSAATTATAAASVEHDKPTDYLEQLRLAQSGLMEHNQKINQLLGNIDVIKEKEEMQREILKSNEELSTQLNTMRAQMTEKEKEINNIRQKEQLTKEMTSMLDIAYQDFNVLQDKIQKLESQLTTSKMRNLELEDLKEVHTNISKDLEEQRHRATVLAVEKQEMHAKLVETEDKLREAIFQKQQMQKRVSYLEELNADLQAVSDANKKLESQLRRVGELESMLNVVSEERDSLMRNHVK